MARTTRGHAWVTLPAARSMCRRTGATRRAGDIQIGYLILKSTAAQPLPDPVVFLAGGPGSSPLTLAEIWAPFFAGLRQERDVVFFDQRGTRLSSPLRCEAYTKIMALELPPAEESGGAGTPVPPAYPSELINPDQVLQQAEAKYGPIADACVQQIIATGVDLSQYTTVASATDVVALVKTLGYDDYNLYGISYGTRLALEVMRNHPESGLRSVVLDSTVPPEVKSYERVSAGPHETVIQLFADCERDPTCNAAYPDLEARFITLLAQLRSQPVIAEDGTTITDRDLIKVMQSLTARVEIAPYLPLMISELERGEDQTYRGIVSGSLAAPTYVPAAVAPPETAGGAATPAAVAANLSPARRFVLDTAGPIRGAAGARGEPVPAGAERSRHANTRPAGAPGLRRPRLPASGPAGGSHGIALCPRGADRCRGARGLCGGRADDHAR